MNRLLATVFVAFAAIAFVSASHYHIGGVQVSAGGQGFVSGYGHGGGGADGGDGGAGAGGGAGGGAVGVVSPGSEGTAIFTSASAPATVAVGSAAPGTVLAGPSGGAYVSTHGGSHGSVQQAPGSSGGQLGHGAGAGAGAGAGKGGYGYH